MMSERDKCDSRSREKRVHAAIVDYLQRIAHAQTVDVTSFLACHGDLRPGLEEIFDSFATTDGQDREDVVRTDADARRDECDVAEITSRLRLLERLVKP